MNRASFFGKLVQAAAAVPFVGAIAVRSAQPQMIYGEATLGESIANELPGTPSFDSFGPEADEIVVFARNGLHRWDGPLNRESLRALDLDPNAIQVAVFDAEGFIRETFDVTRGMYR